MDQHTNVLRLDTQSLISGRYDRFIQRLVSGATEMDILTYVYDATTDSATKWHMVKSLQDFGDRFFSAWNKGRARNLQRTEWLFATLNAPKGFRDFFYRWLKFFDARRILVFLVHYPCSGTTKRTVAGMGVEREFDCYSIYYRDYEGTEYNPSIDRDVEAMRAIGPKTSRRTIAATLAHSMLLPGAAQIWTILEDGALEDVLDQEGDEDDNGEDADSAVSATADSMSSRGDADDNN